MLELTTSVQYVKGIGPRVAEVLAAKGIHTVDDLLHYLPFRYEDSYQRTQFPEIRFHQIHSFIRCMFQRFTGSIHNQFRFFLFCDHSKLCINIQRHTRR